MQKDSPATISKDTLAASPATIAKNVLICLSDTVYERNLENNLTQFGYKVLFKENISKIEASQTLKAIITDSLEFVKSIKNSIPDENDSLKDNTPVIFISGENDGNEISLHLQAIELGGVAFFNRPVSITKVLDKLDEVTQEDVVSSYRVLIVDDSESIANYYGNLFNSVNISTSIVTDPSTILLALSDFEPDIILMDLHMPTCSGYDLAQVVRQREAYKSIPIVFLSGEEDIDIQVKTLGIGADDFIHKKISAKHLIRSIQSRIKRARELRDLMMCDSLTGLLNHSTIKHYLATELKRSIRNNSPLSFAMIDIDKFKQVNDTYGHRAGDAVIKQLARHMKQRLRSTDFIGRYGGEEFAIIMPDTPVSAAYAVLEEVRIEFSKIRHHYNDQEFQCTFSAGIAHYPELSNLTDLCDLADKNLYVAKSSGRNNISYHR